jgi:hypothetical protein
VNYLTQVPMTNEEKRAKVMKKLLLIEAEAERLRKLMRELLSR